MQKTILIIFGFMPTFCFLEYLNNTKYNFSIFSPQVRAAEKFSTKKMKEKRANIYFKNAFKKWESGDLNGALSDYDKAIEFYPDAYGTHYNRGLVNIELKNYYQAITDFTNSLDKNSKNDDAYYQRGVVKEWVGDIKGACFDMEKVLENSYAEKWNNDIAKLKNSRYDSDLKFVQNMRDIKVKNWMKEKCN